MKSKEQFLHDLLDNHELMTVVKFLNTYLDDTGKLQLGHCISLAYKQGYADCVDDLWEDIPKVFDVERHAGGT